MIRSLRSREKMSNARSPRGVCSTTIGTSATAPPPPLGCRLGVAPAGRLLGLNGRMLDQKLQHFRLPEACPQRREVPAALEQGADRLRGPPGVPSQPLDLGVELAITDRDLLPLGDRLQEQD